MTELELLFVVSANSFRAALPGVVDYVREVADLYGWNLRISLAGDSELSAFATRAALTVECSIS